jgi:hypothetical protein
VLSVRAAEPSATPAAPLAPGEAELERLRRQIAMTDARKGGAGLGRRAPAPPSASDRQDYAKVIAIGVAAWAGLALSAWLAFGENPPGSPSSSEPVVAAGR